MTTRSLVAPLILIIVCSLASAQANHKIGSERLQVIAARCGPRVAFDTIEAVIRQESNYYPYALSINYPAAEAAKQGYPHSLLKLARQPHTLKEALGWTRWLVMHGHSVSIGLMQVNSELASHLGIADLRLLFDPCINMAAGTLILQESFRGQPATLDGLARTFALYNAGSPNWTPALSYAARVIAKAPVLDITTATSVEPAVAQH